MTGKLITEPRVADPDGLYATLVETAAWTRPPASGSTPS